MQHYDDQGTKHGGAGDDRARAILVGFVSGIIVAGVVAMLIKQSSEPLPEMPAKPKPKPPQPEEELQLDLVSGLPANKASGEAKAAAPVQLDVVLKEVSTVGQAARGLTALLPIVEAAGELL